MDDVADLGTIKALANPLRQRILGRLTEHGPATATSLAKDLGVTSGGTSYNLRVLAEHGLVEPAPDRGRGRERWWQATRRNVIFPRRSRRSPEAARLLERLESGWSAEDDVLLERFHEARDRLGPWADALPYSRGTLRVTLTDLEQFFHDYLDLLGRYQQRDPDDPEARTVHTRFVAFPDVGDPDQEGADPA